MEALSQIDLGRWRVSHTAIALAGALYLIASLFLARHFAQGRGEGTALIGTGLLIAAGVALITVGMMETTGFDRLLGMRATDPVGAEHAFQGTSTVMASNARLLGYFFPVATIAFALAMLQAPGWPRWLAGTGVVIGFALLAIRLLGISLPAAIAPYPGYVNTAWFLVAGVFLFRMGSMTGAAAPMERVPEAA